jgi:hypothetical protein
LLLSRERAKFSPARRKVKIAAGIAKAMSRTNFGLTTPSVEIAAVRSKNEFLEVPHRLCELFFSKSHAIRVTYRNTVLDIVIGK